MAEIKALKNILKVLFSIPALTCIFQAVQAQAVLEADGPGNTYELINSVLAPGYNVVEHPECIHPEFGRHITEVWDSTLLRYVFAFHIHVTPDNDRCINFDRQRMEIKTYESSPASLKGVTGETVVYQWKFRLPAGYKPSSNFTHLHQIKAVGGDDADPVFTLTARKGTPNKMELIHNNSNKVKTVNLSLFEGTWVEATERIKVDKENGTYSIEIKNVVNGAIILSYSSDKLMTIRPDNSFIRPKWGIYRSLLNPQDLRDEVVRFAGFSIREETGTGLQEEEEGCSNLNIWPNPSASHTRIEYCLNKNRPLTLGIYNMKGQMLKSLISRQHLAKGKHSESHDLSFLPDGIYYVRLSAGDQHETKKFIIRKY